jgi:hypothetical protein
MPECKSEIPKLQGRQFSCPFLLEADGSQPESLLVTLFGCIKKERERRAAAKAVHKFVGHGKYLL